MKKLIFLLIFFSILCNANAQDITISFQPKESINAIDSILVTNLRTNKSVHLLGDESLLLVKYLTAINSISDKSEIGFVYPNPSNSDAIFTFSLEKNQDIEIDLYNNSGQLLSKEMQKLVRGTHRFELKFPEGGIYYLSLLKNDGLASFKTIYTGRKSGNSSISYLGSQKLNLQNSEVNLLKRATTDREIEYATGDFFLYSFFSGQNTTILTDKPTDSKTIDVEFTSCIDPDNKNYKAVKIGSQWWMAENLAYLPVVTPSSVGSDTTAYYYVYDYSGVDVAVAKATANYTTYGVLYNWTAAKASCPAGWHLPSDEEWKQLELTLGMTQQQADTTGWRGTDQGKQMKSSSGWSTGNGTNTSGFSALPSGYRYSNGSFMHIGGDGCWWSSTDYSTNEPWYHFVSRGNSKVHRNHNYNFRKYAWSVRCVKDE